MACEKLLRKIVRACRNILGEKLIGVYVHGSLAFGCFRWDRSDVDFLVVAEAGLTLSEKEGLIQALQNLSPLCPPKGLEMSVVLERYCKNFVYPTPYELHFSNAHASRCREDLGRFCREMHGVDPDLAAHFTVTRAVGFAAYGKEISSVFGPVPRECYLESIRGDVSDAEREILGDPVYITLNLCRVYACLRDGLILSKEQGGVWGLGHLPAAYHPVVEGALRCYRYGGPFQPVGEQSICFAQFMKKLIFSDGAIPL